MRHGRDAAMNADEVIAHLGGLVGSEVNITLEISAQVPAFYRMLTRLLDDPRLPKKLRLLVLAAVAYFILPVDIIPEELEGPYGYMDDIWLCAFVANRVQKEIGTDEILVSHWDGEGTIIPQPHPDVLGSTELRAGAQVYARIVRL